MHNNHDLHTILACEDCHLLVKLPALTARQKALCPRCDFLLLEHFSDRFGKMLAFATTAFIFLMLSVSFPFLFFSAQGQQRSVTLFQSVTSLVAEGQMLLAVGVFLSIFLIPALLLGTMIYSAIALRINRVLPGVKQAISVLFWLRPWAMADIFLLAVLVSFIKVVLLADIALGLSFWSYIFATVFITLSLRYLDKPLIWRSFYQLLQENE